jgi:hypothetical protein
MVQEADPADKGAGRLLLHRPQAEVSLFPVTYRCRNPLLGPLAGERTASSCVPHDLRVGAGIEVFLAPVAQQEPTGLDLGQWLVADA